MPVALSWSRRAYEDLIAIHKYLAKQSSPEAATRVIERIVEYVDRVEIFPESGRIVPELGEPRVREILVYNYRVVYRLLTEAAEVIRVRHTSRRLRKKDFEGLL